MDVWYVHAASEQQQSAVFDFDLCMKRKMLLCGLTKGCFQVLGTWVIGKSFVG
jgi:hypothetical protein